MLGMGVVHDEKGIRRSRSGPATVRGVLANKATGAYLGSGKAARDEEPEPGDLPIPTIAVSALLECLHLRKMGRRFDTMYERAFWHSTGLRLEGLSRIFIGLKTRSNALSVDLPTFRGAIFHFEKEGSNGRGKKGRRA